MHTKMKCLLISVGTLGKTGVLIKCVWNWMNVETSSAISSPKSYSRRVENAIYQLTGYFLLFPGALCAAETGRRINLNQNVSYHGFNIIL